MSSMLPNHDISFSLPRESANPWNTRWWRSSATARSSRRPPPRQPRPRQRGRRRRKRPRPKDPRWGIDLILSGCFVQADKSGHQRYFFSNWLPLYIWVLLFNVGPKSLKNYQSDMHLTVFCQISDKYPTGFFTFWNLHSIKAPKVASRRNLVWY